jgi:hypothetical protein
MVVFEVVELMVEFDFVVELIFAVVFVVKDVIVVAVVVVDVVVDNHYHYLTYLRPLYQ